MAKVRNEWEIRDIFKRWQKNVKRDLPRALKVQVVDKSILLGKSPVRGDRNTRYQRYSVAYKNQIPSISGKKISPVNLRLTGKMLKSLRFTNVRDSIIVEFTDKKAPRHDFGEGNLPQRKMLPSRRGEQFTITIQRAIQKVLDQALTKARRS